MRTIVKWIIRVGYILIALGILIAGIIVSFVGAYDGTSFDSSKTLQYTSTGVAASTQNLYDTGLANYKGIIGIVAKANTQNTEAITYLYPDLGAGIDKKYLRNTGDTQWYSIDFESASGTLGIAVVSAIGDQITLIVYTTKDVRPVPRVIGFVLLAIFIALVIVFEVLVYKYEYKYKGADQTRVDRFASLSSNSSSANKL